MTTDEGAVRLLDRLLLFVMGLLNRGGSRPW